MAAMAYRFRVSACAARFTKRVQLRPDCAGSSFDEQNEKAGHPGPAFQGFAAPSYRLSGPDAPDAPRPVSSTCRGEGSRFLAAARAAVGDREQPHAQFVADHHGEQGRRGVGEQRRPGWLPAWLPTPRATRWSGPPMIRPRKPPDHQRRAWCSPSTGWTGSAGSWPRPHREGQRHHEGDVLLSSNAMPSSTGDHAQRQVVMRETLLGGTRRPCCSLDDGGVQVVRHGRGARQRQARDHGQDGGERRRR